MSAISRRMRTRSARSSTELELRVERAHQLAEVARPPVDGLEDDGDAVALCPAARHPLERRDGVPLRPACAAGPRRSDRRPRPDVVRAPSRGSCASRSVTASRSGVSVIAVDPRGQQIGEIVPLRRRRRAGARAPRRRRGPPDRPRAPRAASRWRDRDRRAAPRRAWRSGEAAPTCAAGIDRAPRLLVDQLAQLAPRAPALERRPRTARATSRSSGRASKRRR